METQRLPVTDSLVVMVNTALSQDFGLQKNSSLMLPLNYTPGPHGPRPVHIIWTEQVDTFISELPHWCTPEALGRSQGEFRKYLCIVFREANSLGK